MFQYEQFDNDNVLGNDENQISIGSLSSIDLSIRDKIKVIMHSKLIHVSKL